MSGQGRPSAAAARAFDQYAAWYNAFNEGKDYVAEARYVLEKAKTWQPAPERWLDIGCGTGNHLAYLQSQGIEVEGVDALHDRLKATTKILMPLATQFYGMREFAFEDPDGYVVTFAERV